MKYVFILGHNPKLSAAEISAVLPQAQILEQSSAFLVLENEEFEASKLLERLGGTIKIGQIIGNQISKKITIEKLKQKGVENKLNFAVSYYDCRADKLGMEIKKELKAQGIACRLVTGKDKALSSVAVTKNKCHEFLVLGKKWLGETLVVQDFEDYSQRDYGRPSRDLVSGSLPPKLAKIMINLAQLPLGGTILDPFCGSGTVIQEGLLLGYHLIGSDISEKAIKDTQKNINWLRDNFKNGILKITPQDFKIFQADVRTIAQKVNLVDAIVTEPYLGPPLKGSEKLKEIEKIIGQLSALYDEAFGQFKKILGVGGKVVIIFPAFRVGKDFLELPILPRIKKMGFTQLNKDKLIYSREGQKVWRQIYIFSRG